MENGTNFCCFAFSEFISILRENLKSETFVIGGKQKENTACLSVVQFGKPALWNNLVMRLRSYKNYFRIKYRPYQPSPHWISTGYAFLPKPSKWFRN